MSTKPKPHTDISVKPGKTVFDDFDAFVALATDSFERAAKEAVAEAHRRGIYTYGAVDGKIIECKPAPPEIVRLNTRS